MRTLLQDSWGELTHEDAYSKSGELPPLVEVLSMRMADLLATLDDIAEDLRNELDRIDEAIVDEAPGQSDTESGNDADTGNELPVGPGADAADILLERWRSLDRPLEISSLAWALQNEFGAEVIYARNRELTTMLAGSLAEVGWAPFDSGATNQSTIVSVPLGHLDGAALVSQLKDRGVVCSARDGNLRLAVHFYNHEDDIGRLVAALWELGRPS